MFGRFTLYIQNKRIPVFLKLNTYLNLEIYNVFTMSFKMLVHDLDVRIVLLIIIFLIQPSEIYHLSPTLFFLRDNYFEPFYR